MNLQVICTYITAFGAEKDTHYSIWDRNAKLCGLYLQTPYASFRVTVITNLVVVSAKVFPVPLQYGRYGDLISVETKPHSLLAYNIPVN